MADLRTTAEERATWRQHAEACPAPRCVPCKSDLRILDDVDTLLAENARLLAVAEAAREYRAMEAPGLDMCRDVARDDLDAALAAMEAP